MTAAEYLAALAAAGIDTSLPIGQLDREAASLLEIDERTARRYRRGDITIPGPVRVALECLGRKSGAPTPRP